MSLIFAILMLFHCLSATEGYVTKMTLSTTLKLPSANSQFALVHDPSKYTHAVRLLGGYEAPNSQATYFLFAGNYTTHADITDVVTRPGALVNHKYYFWDYGYGEENFYSYTWSTKFVNSLSLPNYQYGGNCICGDESRGKIYMMGGSPAYSSFQIYDIASDAWSTGPSMTYGKGWSSCEYVAARERIFVFSGSDWTTGMPSRVRVRKCSYSRCPQLHTRVSKHRTSIFASMGGILAGGQHGRRMD